MLRSKEIGEYFGGLFLIFVLTLVLAGFLLLFSLYNGIGPVPTSLKVKTKLLTNLPEVKTGTLVELGAGWGSLLSPLSNQLIDFKIVGYENSPICFLFLKMRFWKRPFVQLLCEDFWKADLKGSSIVVCYLYHDAMERLKEKLERELEAGTWVITHTFAIPQWTPQKTVFADDIYRTPIYYYRHDD